MKNKVLISVGCVLVVAVLVVAIVFIVSANNRTEEKTIDLSGTWLVYQCGENKVDDEYMVFSDNKVEDYRNGSEKPVATSDYTCKDSILEMPGISKTFSVKVISDNNFYLVEPDTKEWKIIRVSKEAKIPGSVKASELVGEYTVKSVAGEARQNEKMVFTESDLKDYRENEVFLSSRYSLDDAHVLSANDISKRFLIYRYDNVLLFVDAADRYVWELVKV